MAKASTIIKKAVSYLGTKKIQQTVTKSNSITIIMEEWYLDQAILGAVHLYGIFLRCVMHQICSLAVKRQHTAQT